MHLVILLKSQNGGSASKVFSNLVNIIYSRPFIVIVEILFARTFCCGHFCITVQYIRNNFVSLLGRKVPVRRTGAYRHKKALVILGSAAVCSLTTDSLQYSFSVNSCGLTAVYCIKRRYTHKFIHALPKHSL